jgi:exopolysaccharide production protein ExoZ
VRLDQAGLQLKVSLSTIAGYLPNAEASQQQMNVINSLQVSRCMAALAVVVHHASLSTNAFVGDIPAAWLRLFDLGAYGVDFFFVLSGFIIMHAHLDEGDQISRIGPYFFKRLTRIFPAYWPVGLGLLALYAMLPDLSASGGRTFSALSSVLLLPAEQPPALSVAWTLVHELIFYIIFILWFISRSAFWIGLLLWVTAIAVAQVGGGAAGWLRYPLSILNIEFMIGVLAAMAYRRGMSRTIASILVATGGFLVVTMLLMLYSVQLRGEARLALALGLGMLMLGLALRERAQTIAWPALLLALGNASYSLYLVHSPLLSVTQRVAGKLGVNWPLGLVAGVLVSVVCGWLYYLAVERPVLAAVRRGLG